MVAILLAKSHLKIQLGSKDTIPVGFKLFLLLGHVAELPR